MFFTCICVLFSRANVHRFINQDTLFENQNVIPSLVLWSINQILKRLLKIHLFNSKKKKIYIYISYWQAFLFFLFLIINHFSENTKYVYKFSISSKCILIWGCSHPVFVLEKKLTTNTVEDNLFVQCRQLLMPWLYDFRVSWKPKTCFSRC